MATLLSELRRLNNFPFHPYKVMGAGIYVIGRVDEFPMIRDPHAPGTGDDGHEYGWPEKFAVRFLKAETPYRKAQAAVALLKEVVKTNGDCLRLD